MNSLFKIDAKMKIFRKNFGIRKKGIQTVYELVAGSLAV